VVNERSSSHLRNGRKFSFEFKTAEAVFSVSWAVPPEIARHASWLSGLFAGILEWRLIADGR
jgi:hypothetical protein